MYSLSHPEAPLDTAGRGAGGFSSWGLDGGIPLPSWNSFWGMTFIGSYVIAVAVTSLVYWYGRPHFSFTIVSTYIGTRPPLPQQAGTLQMVKPPSVCIRRRRSLQSEPQTTCDGQKRFHFGDPPLGMQNFSLWPALNPFLQLWKLRDLTTGDQRSPEFLFLNCAFFVPPILPRLIEIMWSLRAKLLKWLTIPSSVGCRCCLLDRHSLCHTHSAMSFIHGDTVQ